MKIKRILIFYTSKGLGHKIIAENIGWHLEQAGFQVKLADLLQVQSGRLVTYFSAFHTFINVYLPWLWRFFYTNKLFTDLTLPLRLKVSARNSDRARELIDVYNPDAVLVSQGSFAGVVAHLKRTGDYDKPLIVAFSDFHLHRYWLYDEVDWYLANTDEQKAQMIRLGIAPQKIFVCGITLKPKPATDQEAIRRKLGLLSYEHLVILAAGSLGIGLGLKDVIGLSEALQVQARKRKIHLVLAVICGNNRKLHRELSDLKLEHVKVFSFYPAMAELYQVAEVFLTKPGGLMIAEALSWRLPILITHLLPGQEEWNLEYLLKQELIIGYIPIKAFEKVAWKVGEEIQTHAFAKQLQESGLINQLAQTSGSAVVNAINLTRY